MRTTPWAVAISISGFLHDLYANQGAERHLVEDMLARALADLAGTRR